MGRVTEVELRINGTDVELVTHSVGQNSNLLNVVYCTKLQG
jgi:hypothetical protein